MKNALFYNKKLSLCLYVAALLTTMFLSFFVVGIIFPAVTRGTAGILLVLILGVNAVIACGLLFLPENYAAALKNVVMGFVILGFLLVGADITLRPVLLKRLCFRPHEMFLLRGWPQMPLISRYRPNVQFCGWTYGDLAAISKQKQYRQYRHEVFQVDRFGFRNNQVTGDDIFDILVLGDSFFSGDGVSQEKTLTGILSAEYGHKVYNLSIPGASPWDEYINLAIESARLKTADGAMLLWGIFEGNDLFEYYGSTLDVTRLPWGGFLGRIKANLANFRARSLVNAGYRRILFQLSGQGRDSGDIMVRDFIDGRKMLFSPDYYVKSDLPYEAVIANPNYRKMEEVFAAMKKLADQRRLKVAIVLIPNKEGVYSWVINEALPWSTKDTPTGFSIAVEKLAAKSGFVFLDLKPYFIRQSKTAYERDRQIFWWFDDTHWSDAGHRLASKVIYEKILSADIKTAKGAR